MTRADRPASSGRIEVRRARPDEIDAVADVLGQAFVGSPYTTFTVDADEHAQRIRGLQRMALELIGFDHGEVWVASVDGHPTGAAVFTDSRAPAPASVIIELNERSIEFTGDRLPQSIDAQEVSASLVPDRPHVSLGVVGILPEFQRRGLGSAVLSPGLADADRMGLPVRLETSKETNIGFYERFGFSVTDHVDLGGVQIWAMLREPS